MIVNNNKSTGKFTREEVQQMAKMSKSERERFMKRKDEEEKRRKQKRW